MIAGVLAVIVILSAAVQCGYIIYFFGRLWLKRNKVRHAAESQSSITAPATLKISVLICARNEAANLKANLPKILTQQYADPAGKLLYEVLVVNDQSNDDTAAVLRALQQEYAHLTIVTIPQNAVRTAPGKKFALGMGVGAAKHDFLLMTDADCAPNSKDWISSMAEPFRNGKALVGGYGGFYTENSLLNSFVRAETLHTYLQYLTYNLAGMPYMAVGRNLACKKELLLRAQAHPLWTQTASGDDDLLIQLCATSTNMEVISQPESFTYSSAKNTWKDWVNQKQRHFSTGKLYTNGTKMRLGGYAMSHAFCWLAMLVLLFLPNTSRWVDVAFTFFALRCFLLWLHLAMIAGLTGEKGIALFWPIFDVGWLCYNIIFAPFIFWKNKQQWK